MLTGTLTTQNCIKGMKHSWKQSCLSWDSNPVCPNKNPILWPLCKSVDSLTQLSEIDYISTSYAKSAKVRVLGRKNPKKSFTYFDSFNQGYSLMIFLYENRNCHNKWNISSGYVLWKYESIQWIGLFVNLHFQALCIWNPVNTNAMLLWLR